MTSKVGDTSNCGMTKSGRLPEQEVQDVHGKVDFMGLQAFAHRLAHVHGSPRLQNGAQLPPAGQEESYSSVDRHHGAAEPQNLPDERKSGLKTFSMLLVLEKKKGKG